jgi:hypothetical protein
MTAEGDITGAQGAQTPGSGTAKSAEKPAIKLDMRPSLLLVPWLAQSGASLVFTTYQLGKVSPTGHVRSARPPEQADTRADEGSQ